MPSMYQIIIGVLLFGAVFGFGSADLYFTNPEAYDKINNYEHQMTDVNDVKILCQATKEGGLFSSNNAPVLEDEDCDIVRSTIEEDPTFEGYTLSEKTYVYYSYTSPVDGMEYEGRHEQRTYHDGRVINIGDPLSIYVSKTDPTKTKNGKLT